MGGLVWVRFFFPQTSGDRIFCMTFLCLFCLFVCLFFSALYAFFFFSARISFAEISLQNIIFILKSPIPPPHSKIQRSAPKENFSKSHCNTEHSLRTADVFPIVASLYIIFRRERSDDRKYVCRSQAIPSITIRGIRKLSRNRLMSH